MNHPPLTPQQIAALSQLAQGIIPSDHRDDGAAAVNAGARLSETIASGVNAVLYWDGLRSAEAMARQQFGKPAADLTQTEATTLLISLRDTVPGFVKQLRMDVSALYLSDPGVWERIGFPGPSFEKGGYPDFDRPQK